MIFERYQANLGSMNNGQNLIYLQS